MDRMHDSPDGRGEGHAVVGDEAQQAALLIDFDNVTMGIRSNLGQELRNLLNSDVIRGKVAVQRAYADWRRYPQYIVPLSESSIDLIFAPAYGSSKKNATDIRLAIDALELVFIRPEIRTFILMSGDSDFSSLVLKLKEYGKYVIGVGIQESSSDLLVQNCDEYYSYTALSGLSKTSDQVIESHDPWVLVEKAVSKMVERGDTMRSDRLKQVMLEIDPSFDEKEHGFSKFNRFVVQAASKGLVSIQKMENGQYGVAPGERGGKGRRSKGAGAPAAGEKSEAKGPSAKREKRPSERRERGRGRDRARGEKGRDEKGRDERARDETEKARPGKTQRARPKLTLQAALALLDRALGILLEGGDESVRDSDVKRRMLELEPAFDEGELGYSKFSKFLQAAEEEGAIRLSRGPNGNFHVSRGGERKRKGERPLEVPEGESAGESTMRRLARFFFGAKQEGAEPSAELAAGARSPSPGPVREERPKPETRTRDRGRGPNREAGREPPEERAAEPSRPGGRGERDRGRGRRGPERPRGGEGAQPRDRSESRRSEARPDEAPKGPPSRGRARPREERPPKPDEGRPSRPEPAPEPAAAAPSAAAKEESEKAVTASAGRDTESAGSKDARAASTGREGGGPAVKEAPLPGAPRGTIRGRWGSRGRYRPSQAPPPIFEGQTRGDAGAGAADSRQETVEATPSSRATDASGATPDADIVAHLTAYPGVGGKTAEALVNAFGEETFRVLDEQPDRVREILPDHRAERVLDARREERETEGR